MEICKPYDTYASTFNTLRNLKQGETFKTKEMEQLLKFLPCVKNFLPMLVEHKVLIRNADRTYSFPTNAVYWNNLRNALEAIRKKQREYTNKYLAKKKKELSTVVEDNSIEKILKENNISNAELAKYLISTGNYKIQVKQVTWEEL